MSAPILRFQRKRLLELKACSVLVLESPTTIQQSSRIQDGLHAVYVGAGTTMFAAVSSEHARFKGQTQVWCEHAIFPPAVAVNAYSADH